MSEHPMLFKGEMVCATLKDEKTQTRRVPTSANTLVDGKRVSPKRWAALDWDWTVAARCEGCRPHEIHVWSRGERTQLKLSPIWRPGDTLWVRETWRYDDWTEEGMPWIAYKADGSRLFIEGCEIPEEWDDRLVDIWETLSVDCERKGRACDERWRPSIHMPRWASRITLDVTDVRVERLQEITYEGMKAEGCLPPSVCGGHWKALVENYWIPLWDSINKKRGFGWDANPWIPVVTYKRQEGPR